MEAINDEFDITDLTHETEGYIDTFEADYTITTTHTNEDECMEHVKSFKRIYLKEINYNNKLIYKRRFLL